MSRRGNDRTFRGRIRHPYFFGFLLTMNLAILLSNLLLPHGANANPVEIVVTERIILTSGEQQLVLPVYSTHSFDEMHGQVRRLVIAIHGATRRADQIHDVLVDAGKQVADSQFVETWLISPQFLYESDLDFQGMTKDVACWSHLGWVKGDPAVNAADTEHGAVEASSYALIDALIRKTATLSPALEEVVLVGHSAGAQMVQRYASTTRLAEELNSQTSPSVRYVIANPAGYLYFDKDRPGPAETTEFHKPPKKVRAGCPGYNDWHWGLDNRNAYADLRSKREIRRIFYTSRVHLFAGTADTLVSEEKVSGSCEAMLQGENRLIRARNFNTYLKQRMPEELHGLHEYGEIEGVGHDLAGMLGTEAVREVIFRELPMGDE